MLAPFVCLSVCVIVACARGAEFWALHVFDALLEVQRRRIGFLYAQGARHMHFALNEQRSGLVLVNILYWALVCRFMKIYLMGSVMYELLP